jgi:hypothetical protein
MRETVNRNHTCWFDPVTLTQLVERYNFKLERIVYLQRDAGVGKYIEKVAPQWSRDFVGVFERIEPE